MQIFLGRYLIPHWGAYNPPQTPSCTFRALQFLTLSEIFSPKVF